MSINFVSTAVLKSEDGISYEKEEQTESEETRLARQRKERASSKPLYEQLAEQRESKQAEIDESRRFMHVPVGLDEDDLQYYSGLESQRAAERANEQEKEEAEIMAFRSSQSAVSARAMDDRSVGAINDAESRDTPRGGGGDTKDAPKKLVIEIVSKSAPITLCVPKITGRKKRKKEQAPADQQVGHKKGTASQRQQEPQTQSKMLVHETSSITNTVTPMASKVSTSLGALGDYGSGSESD